jgi:hypothetical protein
MMDHSISRATQADLESTFLVYVTWCALVLFLLWPLVVFLVFYIHSGFKDNIDDVQLFWLPNDIPHYAEGNSSVQCALLDGEWHTYRFPVSGADAASISKLRLDFVREFSVAAAVDVRDIQAATTNVDQSLRVKIEDAECSACRVVQQTDLLSVDQIEFDPFVEFHLLPPLTTATEFIQLEMRIVPRRLGPLNWIMRRVETNTFNLSSCRASIHNN